MALLNNLGTALTQAFNNPLIQLGISTAAAGAQPGATLGTAMATGMKNTMTLQEQLRQKQIEEQLKKLQMQKVLMELQQQQAQQAAMQKLAQSLGGQTGQIPPETLAAFPDLLKSVVKEKFTTPESIRRYQWLLSHPQEAAKLRQLGLAGPPQTVVKVDTGLKKGNIKAAELGAVEYTNLAKRARELQQIANSVQDIDNLLAGRYTGAGGTAIMQLQKYAKLLGIDIGDTPGPKEAAQALARQLALKFRNPDSGFGLPGATSNRDLIFLQSMTPGLEMTPEGRKLMRTVSERMAKRAKEYLRWAYEYRKKMAVKGEPFDPVGFELYAAAKAEENPLFSDLKPLSSPQSEELFNEADKIIGVK